MINSIAIDARYPLPHSISRVFLIACLTAVLSIAAAIPSVALGYNQEKASLPRGLPKGVLAFIDRRAACRYFSGELPDSPSQRQREVEATLKRLRCGSVYRDENILKNQYADKRDVLKAIADSENWQTDD
jgi:hypothetical protein